MDIPNTSFSKVLIVGDAMLDRYWFGEVERISPEAPVPIAKINHTEDRPGGAANVARNVAALGGRATLLSVVGQDEPGATLTSLLEEGGIDASLYVDKRIATTVKLRVVARNQQLMRIDFDAIPDHEILQEKFSEYSQRIASCDVVILSDYGKGGLAHIQHMINLAVEVGKPVLVDPKGDNYDRYQNATIITPNRAELRQVVGNWSSEQELRNKIDALRERNHFTAVLLTRSDEGMTLYTAAGQTHVDAIAREVFDVSGAGDTVIATLAVMMAAGQDMVAAMQFANQSAGIVVRKLGTATCTLAELKELDTPAPSVHS